MKAVPDVRPKAAEATCAKAVELLERLGRLVVVDVETTGFDPAAGRVVEVAAAEFVGETMTAAYTTVVRGEHEPNARALRNAVPAETIRMAPPFRTVAGVIASVIAGADVLVGQNIGFDMSWLRTEFERTGTECTFPDDQLDTIALGKAAYPGLGSYRLGALAAASGARAPAPKHRALNDVLLEHEVLVRSVEELVRKGDVRTSDDIKAFFGSGIRTKSSAVAKAPPTPDALAEVVDEYEKAVGAREALDVVIETLQHVMADYGERHGLKVLRGKTSFVKIGSYPLWDSLSRDDEAESAVREILTKEGIWGAVSELSEYAFARAIDKGLVPEDVKAKLTEFGKLHQYKSFRLFPAT